MNDGVELTLDNMKETSGTYKPNDIFVLINDLKYLLPENNSEREKIEFKNYLNLLMKNSNESHIHFVVQSSTTKSNIISQELVDASDQHLIIGPFDKDMSNIMLNKDISMQSMDDIPGRGFIKNKNDKIYQIQIYHAKSNDIEYLDEDLYQSIAGNQEMKTNIYIPNEKKPKRKYARDDIMRNGKINYDLMIEGEDYNG